MGIEKRIRLVTGIERPEYNSRANRVRKTHGARLLAVFGNACGYCAEPVTAQTYTLDHYIPLQCGGNNRLENFVVCCSRCNGSKGMRDSTAWMRYKGYDVRRLARLRDAWFAVVNELFGPWRPDRHVI